MIVHRGAIAGREHEQGETDRRNVLTRMKPLRRTQGLPWPAMLRQPTRWEAMV